MTFRDQLLNNSAFIPENGVFYQADISRNRNFENDYLRLREKEGRYYTDDITRNLPAIPSAHPLQNEWSIRRQSLEKLTGYLRSEKSGGPILELGCGNGWLSHALAVSLECEICGMDVNEAELLQGSRVFGNAKNLNFIYADIFTTALPGQSFDTIVLASSIQYFPDISILIKRLLPLLKPSGEIHIIDSPFYTSESDAREANKRSTVYFQGLGFPQMSANYFHHRMQVLKDFNFKLMFDPHSFWSKVRSRFPGKEGSPFPWIVIQNI